MGPDIHRIAAQITDPASRARFLEAVAGGRPLSDGELFEILSEHADPQWRSLVLGAACPDMGRRAQVLELFAAADIDTSALLDSGFETGSMPSTHAGDLPRGERSTAKRAAADGQAGAAARAGEGHRAGPPRDPPPPKPDRIGKYRIVRYLGGGGFGHVWQGWDDDLDRPVAIKVPKPGKLPDAVAAEKFRDEARVAAKLSHPHLVDVFEVGRDADHPIFIVSRFIEGPSLRDRLEGGPLPVAETARLVAQVARALAHIHVNGDGLLHRDVKPENILLSEKTNAAFLADFGLVVDQGRSLADTAVPGTPRYMSPEQAGGERIDARSDVFSLGSVLYEALTRTKPFSGASRLEVLEAVKRCRPIPPRDRDTAIPAELERICLRALEKGRYARYQTAALLADDLEAWLAEGARGTAAAAEVPVEPKGLRSFDANDAGFFLQLLPGARGRDGLPESVRFWKTRLEETDPDKTFAIGLLYGPSGCGKSSLVKAGIVPRLGAGVRAIVLEASADDTEARLLKALGRAVPGLPADAGLVAALARVREIASGKVVVILDQFEQWLQGHADPSEEPLVAALRQCDGAKLQAVVLVRDDFGLAAFRFMQAVETPIVEGVNCATIDSFPIDHARAVLVRFGQGLGRLPPLATSFSSDENAFLDEAIAGLAGDEGRVVPVQLALFADLVKTRAWAPATLGSLGDRAGGSRRLLDRIGVAFLENSFDSRSANPAHRAHGAAARLVLEALLPETGTAAQGLQPSDAAAASGIKGHKRPVADLRLAAEKAGGRGSIDALLPILDGELRLITPTDPPGGDSSTGSGASPRDAYYQLTHDYLVRALRDWLTAGKRATAQGRAELALAERTGIWSERQEEAQQLPGLVEWLRIRWFTRPADWRPAEKKLMARAGRLHGTRGIAAATLVALAVAGGVVVRSRVVEGQREVAADGAAKTLLTADMAAIEGAIQGLAPHATRVLPKLADISKNGDNAGERLNAALAVARLAGATPGAVGDEAAAILAERLLSAEPDEVAPIVKALAPRASQFAEHFAAVAADPAAGPKRLRAAAALATFAPEGESWPALAPALAGDLVNVPAVYLATWLEAFRGVRGKLVPSLVPIVSDTSRSEIERSLAADILADYAADDPATLAELAMTMEAKQFAALAARVEEQSAGVVPILEGEIAKRLPAEMPLAAPEREVLGIRQAKAGAVLSRLGKSERVWPLLIHSPDPRVRSYLIHFLGPFGADPGAVAERLKVEGDLSAKRALVLALGEMAGNDAARAGAFGELRAALVPALRGIFETDPDPGLHSAAEWTLKQCGDGAWVAARVAQWRDEAAAVLPVRMTPEAVRLSALLAPPTSPWKKLKAPVSVEPPQLAVIRKDLSGDRPKAPRWYVNGQGQPLVVVPGPVEFLMGSTPESDADRSGDEQQHVRRIGRTFAIGLKHVTLDEYERIAEANYRKRLGDDIGSPYVRSADLPAGGMNWFMAASYCNALSRAEGLPRSEWVYEETGGSIKLAEGWLGKSGYRLPTEAEWEYASRAGALTSRFYGQSEPLLGDYAWYEYAWYEANSSLEGKPVPWSVGLKKPNATGLFDGLGNVWNWCQDEFNDYPTGAADDDAEGSLTISRESRRVLRGGSFASSASLVRSANRNGQVPTTRLNDYGLRVARTLPPVSLTALPERGGSGERESDGQGAR